MSELDTLQRIFREVFDDETLRVTEATGAKDLEGWDSIAQVKLVLTIESELGIHFETDEVSKMRTVGDFLGGIRRHKEA
jgi:acyl carrier protein